VSRYRQPIERLALPLYRTLAWAAVHLPERWDPGVTAVAGRVASAVMRRRRRLVARHLRRVRDGQGQGPVTAQHVRSSFTSYAQYWLDTFRMVGVDAAELDERLEVEGLEHIDDAVARGRGAVVATAHLGSWDLGGAWLGGRGYPVTAVVERLRPPELLDFFIEIRERLGMTVVVRGPDVRDDLAEALDGNALVALVCDRDLGGRGVEVEFFGARTTLPPGPAQLARRCGSPLLPGAAYQLGGGRHRAVILPPVPVARTEDEREDVAVTTQRLARRLEDLIRAAPEQWHLMQPNWPGDDRR
jgi:phosphatidylinositol dimannoside acyltransferase